jgi:hypothetical protein
MHIPGGIVDYMNGENIITGFSNKMLLDGSSASVSNSDTATLYI